MRRLPYGRRKKEGYVKKNVNLTKAFVIPHFRYDTRELH
jgi:hypothetical protein